MSRQVKNQPLRFHGGKSYLASWLHSLAPVGTKKSKSSPLYTHRNIVFSGGLGEFWNWLPYEGISECINDANDELINFYSVLRDERLFKKFQTEISLYPPFSRTTWKSFCETVETDTVKRAVAFFVRFRMSRQGLAKDFATPTRRTRRGMNENVSAYLSVVDGLVECHERIRRVELDCLDFRDFIEQRDHPNALFYLDPTYLPETRVSHGEYGQFEMSKDDHRDMLDQLSTIEGKFMLSGYESDMYNKWAAKHGYECHQYLIDAKSSSKREKDERIECVWTNY